MRYYKISSIIHKAILSIFFYRCHTFAKILNTVIITWNNYAPICINKPPFFIFAYWCKVSNIESGIIIFAGDNQTTIRTNITIFIIQFHAKKLGLYGIKHIVIFVWDNYFSFGINETIFAIFIDCCKTIDKYTSFIIFTGNDIVTICIYESPFAILILHRYKPFAEGRYIAIFTRNNQITICIYESIFSSFAYLSKSLTKCSYLIIWQNIKKPRCVFNRKIVFGCRIVCFRYGKANRSVFAQSVDNCITLFFSKEYLVISAIVPSK